MKFVGYVLLLSVLWSLCISLWEYDEYPPYCDLEWWPSRDRYKTDISMDTPAMYNARPGAPQVFFVAPHLPFFCARLASKELHPMELVEPGFAPGQPLGCGAHKRANGDKASGPPLSKLFCKDCKTLHHTIKALRDKFSDQIEISLRSRCASESISLVLLSERFKTLAPEKRVPDNDMLTPCYRLPKGRRLRTDRIYRLSEYNPRDGGVRDIYLWPLPPSSRKQMSIPMRKPYFFQHYGRCAKHVGFDFGADEHGMVGAVPPLRYWYRWSLKPKAHSSKLNLFKGQKASFAFPGYLPRFHGKRNCTGGCVGETVYHVVGYPPVLSSMWMPRLPVGTRLQLELQAVHPLGTSSAPQRIDFRWQYPHVLQKAHARIAAERLFFRINHRLGWLFLIVVQGGVLLFWWLWRRRRNIEQLLQESISP